MPMIFSFFDPRYDQDAKPSMLFCLRQGLPPMPTSLLQPRLSCRVAVAVLALLTVSIANGGAAQTLSQPMATSSTSTSNSSSLPSRGRGFLAQHGVMLGGGVYVAPEYEGSDKVEATPIPFLMFNVGERIVVDPSGVEVTLMNRDALSFRMSGRYEPGRKEGDSAALRGLGDIDDSARFGATLSYEIETMELYGTVETDVGGSDGTQAIAGAVFKCTTGRLLVTAGFSATWSDDKYMSSYFGVTSAQSARSGLATYRAGAGLKRADVELAATYMFDDHWMLRGQVGLGYLLGDAADSPIVKREAQPNAVFLVGYRF
ncbi:MipA/OmpV family protein [Arenibacterium sp. LLYu02]|uniref:MipA/OmpV family protein n=1 Tax=Arenibacterium sp. LLYu02 TaxID=3404132 RepID=UPI003B20F082